MPNLSRRAFVKNSATLSTGIMIAPNLITNSPSKKLNLAFIGVGGRGGKNLKGCAMVDANGIAQNNVVAMCDVSPERAAKAYSAFPNAKKFTDFRKMLDKMEKEIDAVVISTPDHTHFAATMHAMQLGKQVYVEKPLAHNIWELRTLKKAAKKYNIISQMGNQGHTTNGIRQVKEWYDAGILGEVREVIAWRGGPGFSPTGYFAYPDNYPPHAERKPKTLDWDAWLGPVKHRPYSHFYLPKLWRGWYEFGNGLLGDWACHTLDAPFWALNLGMPTSTNSLSRIPAYNDDFVSDHAQVEWNFPARGNQPPVRLTWFEGDFKPVNRPEWGLAELPNSGMIMVGSKKSLITGGRPNNPKLLVSDKEWIAFQKLMPAQTIPRVGEEDPQGEWINAIKGDGPMPGSTFEYGADLTEMALVGVLAQRFSTKIEYDAKNMRITNHPELQHYIKEPARQGWGYGDDFW